jgi:ribosomal protein L40E
MSYKPEYDDYKEYDDNPVRSPYRQPRFATYDAWKLATEEDYLDEAVCTSCGRHANYDAFWCKKCHEEDQGIYRCTECEVVLDRESDEVGTCTKCTMDIEGSVHCPDFDTWTDDSQTRKTGEYSLVRVTQECPVIVSKLTNEGEE